MRAADPNLKLLAAATPDRGLDPAAAEGGRQAARVCLHPRVLAAVLGQERDARLPDVHHALGRPGTDHQPRDRLLEEAGCRGRVKIAFDEWNLRGWHHPGFPRNRSADSNDPAAAALIAPREINAIASQYTMADALFSASFLNACLRHADDVGMANIAPIVNTRGPLYVIPEGIVKRTTFHVLAMYANLLREQVAKAEVVSDPLTPRRANRAGPGRDRDLRRDAAGSGGSCWSTGILPNDWTAS